MLFKPDLSKTDLNEIPNPDKLVPHLYTGISGIFIEFLRASSCDDAPLYMHNIGQNYTQYAALFSGVRFRAEYYFDLHLSGDWLDFARQLRYIIPV